MGTDLCKKSFVEGDEQPELAVLDRRNTVSKCFMPEFYGNIHDFYEIERQVGAGGFGEVWLATERVRPDTSQECHGRHTAIKQIRKTAIPILPSDEDGDDSQADIKTEIEVLKSLDHPTICRLLQVVEDAKNLYLVMEHCSGGELFERIMDEGSINELESTKIIRQVTGALHYCHDHYVLHRDIKPENILFIRPGKKDVKLIDFGISCLTATPMKAQIGSEPFCAPEALKGENCNEKIDMWSVGCVVYIMLSGGMPFGGRQMRQLIIAGTYSLEGEPWDRVSDDAKDFIQRLLQVDPQQRMSSEEAFNHSWLEHAGRKSNPHRASVQLQTLSNFHKLSEFQRVSRYALAKQLDEKNLHQIHKGFCEIDTNHDGTISLAEFKSAWKKFNADLALDEQSIEHVFNDADIDHDHEINYTEFIAAALDQQISQKEDVCWSVFRDFDNGHGHISKEDLNKVLQSDDIQKMFGSGVTDRVWKELLEKVPNSPHVKNDEYVDFDDFVQALCGSDNRPAWSKGLQTLHDGTECEKTKEKIVTMALPVASRQAAVHSSKPSGSRAGNVPMPGLALPIGNRREAEEPPASGGMMLPISSRQDDEDAKPPASGGMMMLPIASRQD